mgnify:FL=1
MSPEQMRNQKLGASVVKALKSRKFDAYYVDTKQEAIDLALSLIPSGDTVSWGGSMTIRDMGLTDAIKNAGCYTVLDRDNAAPGEDIARKALTCDTYLMSTNAMSEDGQLVNIDGNGNRCAALIFGPKSVIIVAGINKIAKTLDDAYSRARNTAAPINQYRFNNDTPCMHTGECGDCKSDGCICANIVISRFCKPAGKVKVIIVGEKFGY